MPCYRPLAAIRGAEGVRVLGSLSSFAQGVYNLRLPCGQCVGCRLDRSRQWAIRLLHEAKLWRSNQFITFTYDDAKLPAHGSLRYEDFQDFMHRLRARVNYDSKLTERHTLRFFCAGEYGGKTARPHYHAIIYNLALSDLRLWTKESYGDTFTSSYIDELWQKGRCVIGEVNFESAAYCARYCVDKVTGPNSDFHYRVVSDYDTGEMVDIEPEFCHMSLKPGIGAKFFERFQADMFPHGKVVSRGKEVFPPKYYDKLFARVDALAMARIKDKRKLDGEARRSDNTRARLAVKESVAVDGVHRFKREL